MSAKKLLVRFFRTTEGREPVREWLKALPDEDRKTIGDEIRAIQFGWPIGMPLVRKMEEGLWEARVDLPNRVARLLFTISEGQAVLLHGFIKKSPKTPARDGKAAQGATMSKGVHDMGSKKVNPHIGSDFEDFLRDEGRLEEATALAIKRVLAWQFARAMERANVTQAEMARRMHTSRAVIRRLLDANDPSVTLTTISKAATVLGKSIRLRLAA